MKPEFNKFGPKHDYRNAIVQFDYQERSLLGRIKEVKRHPVTGSIFCEVKHFNGEDWPLKPILLVLNILPVDYEV